MAMIFFGGAAGGSTGQSLLHALMLLPNNRTTAEWHLCLKRKPKGFPAQRKKAALNAIKRGIPSLANISEMT